ncbi:MAG: VOC family protein [Halioglobus sp.]
MFSSFDHILIDVPDIVAAKKEYSVLLGQPITEDTVRLGNIDLRLREASETNKTSLSALALQDKTLDATATLSLDGGPRDIPLLRANARDCEYHENIASDTGIYAVDHLVLQTGDAQACIELFQDQLGLRLALDQQVPEWGGRMLFFRMGKMTLEVIQNLEKPLAADFFWGMTFLCKDIEQTTARLDAAGIEHSPIRKGRKPGTRVSTVKSHCLGLPTLLIGH